LTEGCVAGVMRSHLLQQWKKEGRAVVEGAYEVQDLMEADELFLTNAIHGIRWVKSFGEKQYGCRKQYSCMTAYIRPLFG
jgi:branched-chain amino acid aminotransferase